MVSDARTKRRPHLVLEPPPGSFNESKAEPAAQQGYSVVEIAPLTVSCVLPVLSQQDLRTLSQNPRYPQTRIFKQEHSNAMACLADASAIIGITDVGLKGINFLYTYIKDLQNVPETVQTLREELELLCLNLNGLESLNEADDATQKEIRETGLFEALNKCDQSCQQLNKDFDTWTKRGLDSFRSKVQVRRNKTRIDGTVARIRNTQRILHCAVSILTLYVEPQIIHMINSC